MAGTGLGPARTGCHPLHQRVLSSGATAPWARTTRVCERLGSPRLPAAPDHPHCNFMGYPKKLSLLPRSFEGRTDQFMGQPMNWYPDRAKPDGLRAGGSCHPAPPRLMWGVLPVTSGAQHSPVQPYLSHSAPASPTAEGFLPGTC